MNTKTHITDGPYKKGATHCNPNARSFTTSVFSGTELIAQTTTFFGGSRFVSTRTADEARLNSMANARLFAASFDLLKACEAAECGCSLRERESGHLNGCWMPAMQAAIARALE